MLRGNKKVGITAEFVAIMKSKENPDYSFFVSSKARRLFNLFNFFFKKTLIKTSKSRLELSNCFNSLVFSEKPKNIFNLGAGFSLEGFYSKSINYYDLDFPEVIRFKKNMLKKICKFGDKQMPKNYHLEGIDLLKNYSVKGEGKSVFFAEGVASYLNHEAFDKFISNIFKNMKKKDIFIYNEKWSNQNLVSYSLLRAFMSLLSRNKSYTHFTSEENAKEYFRDKGFSQVTFFETEGFNIIKLEK